MKKEYINWEETERLIKELGNKIKESGFEPAIIAPVPRGGWCVASILAQIFEIRRTLGISHQKENGEIRVQVSIKDLENENILLIEDSIETGKTLYSIERELIKLGANVKTVCIYVSSASTQEKYPDFFLDVREIPDFVWKL